MFDWFKRKAQGVVKFFHPEPVVPHSRRLDDHQRQRNLERLACARSRRSSGGLVRDSGAAFIEDQDSLSQKIVHPKAAARVDISAEGQRLLQQVQNRENEAREALASEEQKRESIKARIVKKTEKYVELSAMRNKFRESLAREYERAKPYLPANYDHESVQRLLRQNERHVSLTSAVAKQLQEPASLHTTVLTSPEIENLLDKDTLKLIRGHEKEARRLERETHVLAQENATQFAQYEVLRERNKELNIMIKALDRAVEGLEPYSQIEMDVVEHVASIS